MSDCPTSPWAGYDTGTLARDMVALMDALGHQHFAMVGHGVGMWTGYALAADHSDRLDRLVTSRTRRTWAYANTPTSLINTEAPKDTDLSAHPRRHLAALAAELNGRPRKTLGWETPAECLHKLLTA